jgi:uncharacterized protein (DUF486 family)
MDRRPTIIDVARFRAPHYDSVTQYSGFFEHLPMSTILLLSLSNVFMTFAWYGHLRYGHDWPLWKAILISWFIALLEYCLAVPANRFGFVQFSGFQLKIIQEVITISVFILVAIFFLKEKLAWNYLVAFAFLGVAAFFAFAFKASGTVV